MAIRAEKNTLHGHRVLCFKGRMSMAYADYAALTSEYNARVNGRYAHRGAGSVTQSTHSDQSIMTNIAAVKEQYASSYQDAGLGKNKCTDDKDDGKIGFFAKIGNAIEGVLGMGVNMVKEAIKHPIKTAAMIGLCCIPVVGPVIAGGMACFGIYNGVKAVAQAAEAEKYATTDAEAKACWENIGGGAASAAVSALALKGSAGVLKSQIGGLKASFAGGFKQVGADVATQTMTNVKNVFSAPFKKAYKIYSDVKAAGGGKITWDGVSSYAKGKWNSATTKVTEFATKQGEKLDTKVENIRANKETLKRLNNAVGREGSRVTKSGGKFYELLDDGTMVEYNLTGAEVSRTARVGDTSKTVSYANGKTVTENVTYNSNGTHTVETIIKNNGVTTTKTEIIGSKGNVIKSTVVEKGNGFTRINGKISGENTNSSYNSSYNSKTHTGYKNTVDGKTEYFLNGQRIANPTRTQKLQIKLDSSPTVQKLNNIIDSEIKGLGEYTNPFLMGAGGLEYLEEMDK